ncbi:MAG: hypothetical protein JWR85_528 [Marmoricola sp.]|nr:hypothetical protein [Marmoricola sp.]
MLDHLALPVQDVEAAARFYTDVFAALGVCEAMRYERDGHPVIGLSGPDGFPHFWLGAAAGVPHDEVHVAFTAPDRSSVDRVHAAGVAAGAEVLHAPRLWPEYHANYYAFMRDLDGNNVEAVSHTGPAVAPD